MYSSIDIDVMGRKVNEWMLRALFFYYIENVSNVFFFFFFA